MYKQTLSLVAAATLVASLEANSLQLDPIIISASKTEQSLKDVTANMDVISVEEIEERHYSSLLEALNTLPGVEFTQSGGMGQQSALYVRGFANKYTLLLIDGMRVNDTTNFDGAFLDQITLSDVERIEIIKGAQSGIWGADADAGVINIITKKAQPRHFEFYTEAGSYGTRKFGATLSHVIDNADFKIGFDRTMSDGFSAAEPKKGNAQYGERFDDLGWERDPYFSTTLFFKVGLNLSQNDRLEFNHRRSSSFVAFDSTGVDQPDAVVHSIWGDSYYTNRYIEHFNKISYIHKNEINTIQVYAGRSDFEREYYGGYKGNTDEAGVIDTVRYAPSGTLVLGSTWQKFNVDSVAGNTLDKNYIGRALFASNTNTFNNASTILTETLRYDDYSIFGSKVTGKVGVKQIAGEGSLSVNYGTGYKAPSLSDIYPPSAWWMNYNTDLKSENIRSFDITGTYKNMSLTYFYNTIDNMIVINSSYDQMINLAGKSILQGYEAKIVQPLGENVNSSFAYTRLHSADSSGKALQRRPFDSIKAVLDWYPSEKLHTGINTTYIGTRYDDSAQSISTGNYAVFGGVINYKLNNTVDLYAKLDNLFDRYYQNVDGYASAGRSGYFGIKVNY